MRRGRSCCVSSKWALAHESAWEAYRKLPWEQYYRHRRSIHCAHSRRTVTLVLAPLWTSWVPLIVPTQEAYRKLPWDQYRHCRYPSCAPLVSCTQLMHRSYSCTHLMHLYSRAPNSCTHFVHHQSRAPNSCTTNLVHLYLCTYRALVHYSCTTLAHCSRAPNSCATTLVHPSSSPLVVPLKRDLDYCRGRPTIFR